MKDDFLKTVEKLNKEEMFKIRGGAEQPDLEKENTIIGKKKWF